MRKLSLALLIAVLFVNLSVFLIPARLTEADTPDIEVLLDNLPIRFDVPPKIANERAIVPFRMIAQALNIDVDWDGNTGTITASDGKTRVMLSIGNKTAQVIGCEVNWDPKTRIIRLSSPPRDINVIGFYALGAGEASSWLDLFGAAYPEIAAGNTDIVRELALGWYTIDEQGNLLTRSPRTAWQRPLGWEIVLAKAQEFRLKTEMVIHETNRSGLLTAFLNNEQAMLNAVNSIVKESALYGGVNLNLEELGLYAAGEEQQIIRESFTRFVAKLAKPLREAGKTLTLTIQPPNSSFRGYDYAALGQLADRIIVMAHDYGPKPEPNNRVVQAVEMALKDVPAEKLILAISAHSETHESINDKIGIAKRYRLQGISLWRLGLITDDMWNAIRRSVKIRN